MVSGHLDSIDGISIAEAKAAFDNGSVKGLRVDIIFGQMVLIVCTKVADKPVRTVRNKYKQYKSIESLLRDYKFITSNDVKCMLLK